ncbi:MAG: quinol:cytochrome C oxidoreductase [Planctomycetota bacterium]
MTATAPLTAPSLQQLAPHVLPKVKDGDLATAPLALLGIGAALIGLAWATGGEHFYFSYLVGYMGVLGIVLGALFFVLVQHITRAGWSVVLRRVAENVAGVLPFMLLLFVPILVGFDHLFHHWAHANVDPVTHQALPLDHPQYDRVLAGKAGWLNKNAFLVRVAIYFAVWIGLAWFFRSNSLRQDETGNPAINLKLSRVAAPGLLLFALSITFAAFDWIMSLDPHWFSTIFGVAYFAGGYMAFLAFVILLLQWLGKRGYLQGALTTEHYHDLGKLMFAFMVFWTYANFSQYMLIWYANQPEETRWFADRQQHGWGAVGTLLILGHFFVPFAFLMSRHVKRNPKALAAGAIFLLVIHCLDMQFLILPTAGHGEAAGAEHAATQGDGVLGRFTHGFGEYLHQANWADFGCFAGLLALVAGLALLNIRRTNLLPLRDPRLAESLHFQNH